ncbi:inosine 5'-monophosphate dehydrogenase [Posidoniimonas corsicana]|uniref:Inosine 5'-monophosphate dehydrogenase n=1 Tax=Posidoniimonas corsicana TaxID=1938618 RepID=A0A5C5VFX3_9BACT|nr:CBS domain-containing protein [Posidoniimonas corsicana]TWT36810.1 inosine 5'-monophosphate dehydrogenase [Posidoniimonas corsicana]
MLIPCPACGAENIEGADICESCGAPLAELSVRAPQSSAEASLMEDTVDRLDVRMHASVSPEATVGEVLKKMVDMAVGCVTIVDNKGRLAGIFSERDAVTRLGADTTDRRDQPIMKYMTPNPVTVDQHCRIALALQQMDIGGYRHLPVLDREGRPVMLVSIRDILRYLADRVGVAG